MRHASKVLVIAVCAVALCAGCGGSNIQFKRVDATKTAAIVGVSAALDTANRTQGKNAGTVGAMQEMATLGSDEKIAERKEQGKALYDALAAEINKSMGWTMKTRDEVAANAVNKEIYTQEIGEPNSLQLGGMRVYCPDILWAERVRGLTPENRAKLIEALGVDALVFVHVYYYVGRTGPVKWKVGQDGVITVSGEVPGTSAAYPAARLSLEVYDKDFPDAIWADSASGEPANIGIVTTMGVEYKTDMIPIMKEAMRSAWKAVMADFEAAKAEAAAKAAEAAQGGA